SSSLLAKWRYTLGRASPARLAICPVNASGPYSSITARAASIICSRRANALESAPFSDTRTTDSQYQPCHLETLCIVCDPRLISRLGQFGTSIPRRQSSPICIVKQRVDQPTQQSEVAVDADLRGWHPMSTRTCHCARASYPM